MTNESLIQVPSNVEEPLVLQRFLLRLVEELDIVLGKRAASTDDQYVAQKELVAIGTSLTTAIESAQIALEETLLEIEAARADSSSEVESRLDDLEVSQLNQDGQLSVLENISWIRPFTVTFEGRSTNGPVTTSIEYNLASGERIAAGVYEFTLDSKTYQGNDLLARTQYAASWNIAASATSEAYMVKMEITSVATGVFQVSIFAVIQGLGTTIEYAPYDPLSSDTINIMGMYTPVGATNP